jgi:ParB family chromosome partitioning protein
MAKKFGGLGKGLGALIDTEEPEIISGMSSINEILISEIEPNPDQPRKHFDAEAMLELSESIRQIGVIQPITLRKTDDQKYQIIAGERRFRASKMAGLESIPAYIKEINNELMMEMALVENIQREDLNAIEVALSYQNLLELCSYTQEQLSERVGKKRTTVSNYLRLLRLPGEIQVGIKDRKIDMGHARALINVEDPVKQLSIYDQILKNNLSVRKVEELVRAANEGDESSAEQHVSKDKEEPKNGIPEEYSLLKERLKTLFNSKADLARNAKGKGKITIPFANDEELEKIMDIFDSIQGN